MKFNMTFQMMGTVLSDIVKKAIPDKAVQQNIKKMYRDIVLRADDIGGQNRLLGSYALAAFFYCHEPL